MNATKYYFSAYGWGIGNALLVKTPLTLSCTYVSCSPGVGVGCKTWHEGIPYFPKDAVQITKCQARKYLKSWKSVLELP